MFPTLPVERLRLSSRTYNALVRNGIDTIDQLAGKDLRSIPGIHAKGAEEIRRALKDYEEVPVPAFPPRA